MFGLDQDNNKQVENIKPARLTGKLVSDKCICCEGCRQNYVDIFISMIISLN